MHCSKTFVSVTPPKTSPLREGEEAEEKGVAVAWFLTNKNRRAYVPDAGLYRDMESLNKFFGIEAVV
jgi:hypothetical protein